MCVCVCVRVRVCEWVRAWMGARVDGCVCVRWSVRECGRECASARVGGWDTSHARCGPADPSAPTVSPCPLPPSSAHPPPPAHPASLPRCLRQGGALEGAGGVAALLEDLRGEHDRAMARLRDENGDLRKQVGGGPCPSSPYRAPFI